jgi:hypothetical protein
MTPTPAKKRSRKRAQTRARTNPEAHAEETSDVGEVSKQALIPSKSTELAKPESRSHRLLSLGAKLGGLGLAAVLGVFAWRSKTLRPVLRSALTVHGPSLLRHAYARVASR